MNRNSLNEISNPEELECISLTYRLVAPTEISKADQKHWRGITSFYIGYDLRIGGRAWLLSLVMRWFGIGGLYTLATLIALTGALIVFSITRTAKKRAC